MLMFIKEKGAPNHHNASAQKPSADDLERSQSCLGLFLIISVFFLAVVLIEAAL